MLLRRLAIGVLTAFPFVLGAFAEPASAALATPRYAHTTTLLPNNDILVAGGVNTAGTSLQTVEIYRTTDGLTGFYTAAPLLVARASHTATVLPDGRVLVVGGITAGVYRADGEIYEPRLNSWSAVANLMTAVDGEARANHTATLMKNGRVLIVGGQSAAGTTNRSCNFFNPVTSLFETCEGAGTPDMLTPNGRAGHTATLLNDGRVIIAGGYEGGGTSQLVTTEIFDGGVPGFFVAGPALISRRAWHSATGLGNGKVLFTGGYNTRNFEENQGILQSTELYDPVSNTISPAAPMTARRSNHISVLKPNGQAQIIGGLGNITTSYTTSLPDLIAPGDLRLNIDVASPGVASVVRGLVDGALSDVDIEFADSNIVLSVPASGRVASGDIYFSSPQINSMTGVQVLFQDPGTQAPLRGQEFIYVNATDEGNFEGLLTQLTNPQGEAIFASATQGVTDEPILAGSIVWTGGALAPGDTQDLTAAARFTGNVQIPMPSFMEGAFISTGFAIITAGAISRPSDDTNHGFDITLTSGVASFPNGGAACGPVVLDTIAGYILDNCPLNFRLLEGSITSSSPSASAPLPNPQNPTGLDTVGLTAVFFMVPDRLIVNNQTFDFDIATIAIRQAIMGDVEYYDPSSNSWDPDKLNLTRRMQATGTLLPNGNTFSMGGRTCGAALACESLTPVTVSAGAFLGGLIPTKGFELDAFTAKGDLAFARSNHTATVLPSRKLLVAGGTNGPSTVRTSEVYDPEDETWTNAAPLRFSRTNHTTQLLPNGTVLAAGGFTKQESTGSTASAEIFYPDVGIWLETTPMISSRSFHSSVLLPDGNVMVMGGLDGSGQYISSAEIYYSTNRRWIAIPSMATPRAQHTATLLQDGRVLVAGGVNGSGVLGTGATPPEIYDPVTGAWTNTPVLNRERHSHSATQLQDGQVVLIGGNDSFGETNTSDAYDPKSGTWRFVTAFAAGSTMVIGRQDHAASLLPNNKVLITGGFTGLGVAQQLAENFDISVPTFTSQGMTPERVGNHTSSLMADNDVITVGGFNGISDLPNTVTTPFGETPDQLSGTGGDSLRRPEIVLIDTGTALPGTNITLTGTNFLGGTEAGGGGAGSANSDHSHPIVVMMRMDAGGGNASNSGGYSLDLTSRVLNTDFFSAGGNQISKWTQFDTSVTLRLPATNLELPYGYYHVRVGANAQFSDGANLKIGPPVPTGTPTIPIGTLVGVSSVSWAFGEILPAPDGYNVYSATNGVFIATMPVSNCVAGTCTFIQTGLGPDTSALIKVAGYNISGDGQIAVATVPVNTVSSLINGLSGLAVSTQSILWSWSANASAVSYTIFSATSGTQVGTSLTNSFTQTGLSTNTVVSVQVRAETNAGSGALTPPVSVFTLAAVPQAGFPPLTAISTGGVIAQWLQNTNPPAVTTYQLQYFTDLDPTVITVLVASRTFDAIPASPNTAITASISALNGDLVASNSLLLGTTVTLANPASSATVTAFTPNSISLAWSSNGNPSTTTYQILASTDNFLTNISTPVPFSAELRQTSYTILSLFTDTVYNFRIFAQNQNGQPTAFVSTQGFTSGGGGPPGSLAVPVPLNTQVSLSGNLADGRRIGLNVFPGTFDTATTIFVSSKAIGALPFTCGPLNAAIEIVTVPAAQPKRPISLQMSWLAVDGVTNEDLVQIVRLDETKNTCVNTLSSLDTLNDTVTAEINHFSLFQLMQIPQVTREISNARIFPNPVWARNQGFVTFDRLPAAARIRIFTLHGQRVVDIETNSQGVAIWRLTNQAGRPVASGLYLVVIEFEDQKKVLKLAVIR